MTFECETNTETFRQFVNATKEFLTEVTLRISADGISYQELDSSKAALVAAKIEKSAFTDFKHKEDVLICVPVEWLTKVMSRLKSESIVIKTEDESVTIIATGDDKVQRFTGRLVSLIEKDQTKTPDIGEHATVEISTEAFKGVVKDVGTLSAYAMFVISEDSFTVTGESDTGESLTDLDYTVHDESIKRPSGSIPAESRYAVAYLKSLIKVLPKSESLTLSFANNKPLRIEIGIGDVGTLMFVLAPRVDRRR